MIESKRIEERQVDNLNEVSRVVEKSFDCLIDFKAEVSIDEIIQNMTEKCKIVFQKSARVLDLKTVPCLKYQYKQSASGGYAIIDCFCDKNCNIVVLRSPYSHAINIFDKNGSLMSRWTPSSTYNYITKDNIYSAAEVNDGEIVFFQATVGRLNT